MQIKDGGIGTALMPFLNHFAVCDLLNVLAREAVLDMHRAFKSAGASILTSNTFLCDPDTLEKTEFARAYQELSRLGAELARQVAGDSCLVAGSLGPGWKSPRRGEISIYELRERYYERALGLLRGGVDLLWIETVYDPLQAEAALQGCLKAMTELKSNVKLAVLASQTAGQHEIDWSHLLHELNQLPVDILGLNCSAGPASMRAGLEWLKTHCDKDIACCPNAGEPDAYLNPKIFAQDMLELQAAYDIQILGGCCGVTPEHIQVLRAKSF